MVVAQKLAGDGVSPDTLRAPSRRLYDHDLLERGDTGRCGS
jgi:hypothetical protein